MKKSIALILFVSTLLLICSCVFTRNNVDIYPNSEVPDEIFISAYDGFLKYTSGTFRIFDNYRTYMPAEKIFIMQTLSDNAALAHVAYQHYEYVDGFKDRYDNLALLIGDDDAYFYDDMVINVGSREEVKQIGIYTYTTVNESSKTVPIVVIVKENNQ